MKTKRSAGTKVAVWTLIVTIVIAMLGFIFDIFGTPKVSLGEPKFQYIFEGAYDQSKPEYEVAFPLGWDDTQKSNARILLRADYSGSKYPGITYIKIKQADEKIVTVGQWNDFNTKAGEQQLIPLNFSQLFNYAGHGRDIINPDVTSSDPLESARKQFTIFVENGGKTIDGSERTVTVINTPWIHRTYLDTYETHPGGQIKGFVEVINFGAASDFSISICAHRISTQSYQLDPSMVADLDPDGWWPTRKGSFQSIGKTDQQIPISLKAGERQTVKFEMPAEATSEQGVYTIIVYVLKKLPILDYGSANFASNWRSRDGRQYSTYVIVGKKQIP